MNWMNLMTLGVGLATGAASLYLAQYLKGKPPADKASWDAIDKKHDGSK